MFVVVATIIQQERICMKKKLTAVLIALVLGTAVPMTALAQKRECDTRGNYYRGNSRNVRSEYRERSNNERSYYDNGYYENDGYSTRTPNVYDRHRKSMNIAIATGAGAIIGALIGGKKGALIGAAAGVAGGAIITKKQKPRNYIRY